MIEAVRQKQGHQGGISLEDGVILYGIIRALKPQVVVETGVAAGVSIHSLTRRCWKMDSASYSQSNCLPTRAVQACMRMVAYSLGLIRVWVGRFRQKSETAIAGAQRTDRLRMSGPLSPLFLPAFPSLMCSFTTICTRPTICCGNTRRSGLIFALGAFYFLTIRTLVGFDSATDTVWATMRRSIFSA